MNLVIGATGQSGRAAASALASRQGPVRVLLRPGSDDEPYVRAGCEIMRGDLTRPETLAPALESVTGIVNFVGIGHDLKTPRGRSRKSRSSATATSSPPLGRPAERPTSCTSRSSWPSARRT